MNVLNKNYVAAYTHPDKAAVLAYLSTLPAAKPSVTENDIRAAVSATPATLSDAQICQIALEAGYKVTR